MLKKILILGSQRKKSQEIIKFFNQNSQKYKISAILCSDSKSLSIFKSQIQELKPSVVFYPDKKIAEEIEIEFNIKCYCDYLQYTTFLKNSDADIVISDITGIDSVKLILATIGEFKDIGLLNLEPLLYSGKIIINEARNKGVKLNIFTSQFQSLSFFLKIKNINDISKLILCDYDTKENKISLDSFISSKNTLPEFKKIYYYKNKMWLSRHLAVLYSLYNFDLDSFSYYKSNIANINLILQLKNGNNVFYFSDKNKESIFSYYYLDSQENKNNSFPNTIDIKLSKINYTKIPTLDLMHKSIVKGGTYPILYQIVYDYCAEKIYQNKLPKDAFLKIFPKILENKAYYTKSPNIQTIYALDKKIKDKIDKEFIK